MLQTVQVDTVHILQLGKVWLQVVHAEPAPCKWYPDKHDTQDEVEQVRQLAMKLVQRRQLPLASWYLELQ